MQSQMVIHGTAGSLRVDLFAMFLAPRCNSPAQGRRTGGQRLCGVVAAAGRRARGGLALRARRGAGLPGPARPGRGLLPPACRRSAPASVGRGRRGDRRVDGEGGRAPPRPTRPTAGPLQLLLYDRRSWSRARPARSASSVVRRLLPTASACGLSCGVSQSGHWTAWTIASATLATPWPWIRLWPARSVVIHCGAAMSGGWPEQYGARWSARRTWSTPAAATTCTSWCTSARSRSSTGPARRGARSARARRSSRVRRSAAPTRVRSSRRSVPSRRPRRPGSRALILRPGLIFGGGISPLGGSVRPPGRWALAHPRRRPSAASAHLHRRRRRRD